MKYKPYPKSYKIRMLGFAKERMLSCERNIKTFNLYMQTVKDREIKSQTLIKAVREMDLLRFLRIYGDELV